MRRYQGTLTEWFETGTEGLVWCLESDEPDAERLLYERLVILEEGHVLRVWDEQGVLLFDGQIREDSYAGWNPSPWQPRPYGREWLDIREVIAFLLRRAAMQPTSWWSMDPKALEPVWEHYPEFLRKRIQPYMHGQPAACGCWVHWTQKGWSPDAWARLFLREESEGPVRAQVLVSEPLTYAEQVLLRSTISIREYAMVLLRAVRRMTVPTGLIIGGDEHDDDSRGAAHIRYVHAVGQLLVQGIDILAVGKYSTVGVRQWLSELSGIHPEQLRTLRRTFKRHPRTQPHLRDFLRRAWSRGHLRHLRREPTHTVEELYWLLFEQLVFSGVFAHLYLLPDSSRRAVHLAAQAQARGLAVTHFSPRL